MQSVPSERKRNKRKSSLTPKKSYKAEDSPPTPTARVGGRLKKAKIPFDPSSFTVTKRRQTEPCFPSKKVSLKKTTAPSQQNVCCHCKKSDKPEVLIHCKGDCETRIHLTCLQSTCDRFGKNEELSWECYSCQTCRICNKNDIDDDTILKCYICYSYYHVKCHGHEDKMKIVKDNRFDCRFCVSDKVQKNSTANDANSFVPKKTRAFAQTRQKPVNSENKFSNDGFLGFNANELEEDSSTDDESVDQQTIKCSRGGQQPSTSIEKRSSVSSENRSSIDDDTKIPDVSKWSDEEVFTYFHGIFPEYAHVFKHLGIDGPSLYLLKRTDIIKGFNIELGPALKIYGHILKLQTKCSDPTLSWH